LRRGRSQGRGPDQRSKFSLQLPAQVSILGGGASARRRDDTPDHQAGHHSRDQHKQQVRPAWQVCAYGLIVVKHTLDRNYGRRLRLWEWRNRLFVNSTLRFLDWNGTAPMYQNHCREIHEATDEERLPETEVERQEHR